MLQQLKQLIVALRPHQWSKNLFVFAALIFAQRLYHWPSVVSALSAFALFCVLSGTIYLVNDLVDLRGDRRHPVKCHRPLAAGKLSLSVAKGTSVLLAVGGVFGSFALGESFGLTATIYLVLMTGYSLFLKNIVIVDVLTVSFGFVLRAVAGAVVIGEPFSSWLLICTMLFAVFIALNKRRHELTLLVGEAVEHRRILGEYNPYLLDQMIAVVTASTLVSYTLYTLNPETVSRLGTERLVWTLPFVLYGIFRYMYLVHRKDQGGSPTKVLLNDRPILFTVVLWVAMIVAIVYHS